MKKNLLLTVAALFCRFLCAWLIIFFLIITAVLVHWHINPEYYAIFSFPEVIPHHTSLGITMKQEWEYPGKQENVLALNNIRLFSLYLNYVHVSAILLFTFLALKEFLNIIQSVRLIQTFRKENYKSFRKIGKYLFVVFILSSFLTVYAQQGTFFGFYIHITPLVLMLIAYILAEIFKEGNNLLEENQFTV